MSYQFRPQLLTSVVAAVVMAIMIKLGFWQYHKAEQKQALQAIYDARAQQPVVNVPAGVDNLESWRYRRLQAKGRYRTDYQVLLDNQVDGEAVGYHVITPLQTENGVTVLVDRGWIPVGDRSRLPDIRTPSGMVTVTGFSWIPSPKFFELQAPAGGWQPVWQNMDMPRYLKLVPFKAHPFVIRLDADSSAGGFVRHWVMPAERIEQHIGYAYQWWGFSVALFGIWIFVNLKRKPSNE